MQSGCVTYSGDTIEESPMQSGCVTHTIQGQIQRLITLMNKCQQRGHKVTTRF